MTEQGVQTVSSASNSRMLKVTFLNQNNHSGEKKVHKKIHNNNKKKQTNKQNSTKLKQGRQGKEQVFQFQEKIFLGKFLSNIIRRETEVGRALKNFRIITRETPFSHKMKGTSTVYELICVAHHYPCRKLFQIYGLESFSANFPSASCQPS